MATHKIVIPYVVREMISGIEQTFSLRLGCPMNVEFPKDMGKDDDGKPGKGVVHFEGTHFALDILTGIGHYGRWIEIKKIRAAMRWFPKEPEEWMEELQKLSGDFKWEYDGQKLRFALEGINLERLAMNASNRRNGLPTYEWDDPNHPFNQQ